MNIEEILKRIDSVIDCLTESDGGNAVTESDVKDAKVELNELKEQLALHSVSQRSELFKGFLEKVVEETYSGDLTWQTREEAKELLKLFYSTYLIYGEDILS